VRLAPADFAVAVRGRPRGRAGAAALVAVVGALAEAAQGHEDARRELAVPKLGR
jgi:hypothetical protein